MRPHSAPLLLLIAAALVHVGLDCAGRPVEIVSPSNGTTVTTFTFPVEIRLGSVVPAADVEVTLNGEPLALSEAEPGVLRTSVPPGDPLRDVNVLHVAVPATPGGGALRAQSRFVYGPPKARARVVTDSDVDRRDQGDAGTGLDLLERLRDRGLGGLPGPAPLPSGPLAHAAAGDFLLANAEAHFVVQGPDKRDLHSVGQYGGNLIDAALRSKPGLESFFEITPSVNIETVINATRVEILNDGQNGLPALVRACGPDDLIDYINASTQVEEVSGGAAGLPAGVDDQDHEVEGCTEYALEPGSTSVRLETTIFNHESEDLGLFVGDYVNGMGELELWTPPADPAAFLPGFGSGLGEILVTDEMDILSYFGFSGVEGVSYFRVGEPIPGATSGDTSFTTSGVSVVLSGTSVIMALVGLGEPGLVVPANGQASWVRHFGVGDGSGADATRLALDVLAPDLEPARVEGCVRVDPGDPRPAPGARITAGPGGTLDSVVGTWVADEEGCFSGELAPGTYGFAAARPGTPFEGGGPTPQVRNVLLEAGANPPLEFVLPATGRLVVESLDAEGLPIPARVSVVGFDPSPEPIIPFSLAIVQQDTGTFRDITRDALPFGITAIAYTGADGRAALDLEPGDYEVFVSRGTEYSLFRQRITSSPGDTERVTAQIARVLDTAGFVSSDHHVHLINSPDSRIGKVRRVLQFAGEGVENLIATDHDARTDLDGTIEELGVGPWLHSAVGEEITTFDYGHFNAYPLGVDPDRPSGGSVDWAGAAPAGEDFPSFGNFVLPPAEIFAAVPAQRARSGVLLNPSPHVVTQINHIGSHFRPLKIDTTLEPPRSLLTAEEALARRLDPSVGNFFHPFPALELWNGSTRNAQREFLFERLGIWFNHLNQGLRTTFIADTDTHTFLDLRTAGARSWTAASTDRPAEISDEELGAAVLAGRATGGQGIYVQTVLRQVADPDNAAHLGLGGSTELDTGGDPEVVLEIDVQAPVWAEFDTIRIYANAATFATGSNGAVPVDFTAAATQVLRRGEHFVLPPPVEVAPDVPGAQRQELHLEVPFTLTEDTWFVVVVRGSDGVSQPMFPAFPADLRREDNTSLEDLLDGNLGEQGVLALGATNALYANVDGVPGFDPPGVQLFQP